MKKYSLFAASALLALASCSSDNEATQDITPVNPVNEQPVAVQFGSYIGKSASTRATDVVGGSQTGNLSDDNLWQAGFGVFAYYTEAADYAGTTKPNFMYNEKVYKSAKSDAAWKYDVLKYWPNDNTQADRSGAKGSTSSKMSFFAYAPYAEVASGNYGSGKVTVSGSDATTGIITLPKNSEAKEPVLEFKMGTESNIDLLWGTADGVSGYDIVSNASETKQATAKYTSGSVTSDYNMNINLTKQTTGETVDFAFKHALAKVGGDGGLKVLLDVDALRNDTKAGNGTFDATKTKVTLESVVIKNATDGTKPKTSGKFNLATGKWDLTGADEGSFSYTYANTTSGLLNVAIAEPTTTKPLNWSAVSSIAGISTTAQDVISSSADQKDTPLTAFIPGQAPKLTITVTYYVRTEDPKLENGCSEAKQVITQDITLPTLVLNKKYTLYLHLGITSIKFTATVSNWDETTGTDIEQPIDLPSNVN